MSRYDALGPQWTSHMASCSSGVCRYVYEDGAVATVAALQQVLAEQADRTDTKALPAGHSTRHLAGPDAQRAEWKEGGGREAGGSNSGIQQSGLLLRGHDGEAI